MRSERIAVVGLGYVGLPLTLALSRAFPDRVVGFDVDPERVAFLKLGLDKNAEHSHMELQAGATFSANPSDIADATFYIIAVPTPVDSDNYPDLTCVTSASETVARCLKPGDVVVYESTVFPGTTEDICGPILSEDSGLPRSEFKLGYSPERVNPGDKEHSLDKIVKIISAEDAASLDRLEAVYGAVAPSLHRAPSIRVAEAAKVVENVQRDVNIALVNELSKLFARLNISTSEVLAAAGTKWNFHNYKPGLVGGHCVSVDPYYLIALANSFGKKLRLMTSARKVNESMSRHVAKQTIKALRRSKRGFYAGARVGVFGYSFKENVKDTRNSKVKNLVNHLRRKGCEVLVHDPVIATHYKLDEDLHHTFEHEGELLHDQLDMLRLDAAIVAVPHDVMVNDHWLTKEPFETYLASCLLPNGVVVDLKGVIDASRLREDITIVTI